MIRVKFNSQRIHFHSSRILPPTHCVVQTARSRFPENRLLLLILASLTSYYDPS